jgi:opacity protein-like surface antigen
MREFLTFAAVAACLLASPAMAADVVTPDSTGPTGGWQYGSGNDYQPSNTLLLQSGGDELALRLHQTFQVAPASDANGGYSFALGTDPLSLDWDIGAFYNRFDAAELTVTNLLTSQRFTYDPLCPLAPITCLNDNTVTANGSIQNSNRLNNLPVGFDPNVNDTYRVSLTTYLGNTVQHSLTAYAQVGTGATPAVPEPATWAMMLLGFAAVGFGMRKRKASVPHVKISFV